MSFVKVEVKLDQFFVNFIVKITCYMDWKIEIKLHFIFLIYYSTREKKKDMYKFDEANDF